MGTSILIVGLPHFVAARDKYNPSAIFNDIGSERRQAEINDLVAELSGMNLGEICVESANQDLLDQRYSKFLDERRPQSENEIDQIVFRLGSLIGASKIFASNFELPMGEFNIPEQIDFNSWQSQFDEAIRTSYEKGLREVLIFLNDSGSFMSKIYREMLLCGDDTAQKALLRWYERNLAILQKILKIPGENRKTLFIGAGHVPFIEGLAKSLGVETRNFADSNR